HTLAFALGGPLGLGGFVGCKVVLAPNAATWEPHQLCTMLTHEFGHLAGYHDPIGFTTADGTVDHNHSPDPSNVMYPVPSITPACQAYAQRLADDADFRRDLRHFIRHARCSQRHGVARAGCVARKARYRKVLAQPPLA